MKRPGPERNRGAVYAGIILILVAWWLLARLVGRDIIFPSPLIVVQELGRIVLSVRFWIVAGASLARWVAGFAVALVAAILLGTAASRREWIAGVLRPLVVTVRSVPVIAIILLALIWLAIDMVPVFISLLVSLPLLYQGILDGLRSVDRDLIDMGRLFRIPWYRRIVHIHVPSALPVMLPVITSAVGMSWKAVIAAEVLSQPVYAIGTDMQLAKLYLETPVVIAWTVIAVTLAALGDSLVWFLDKRTNAWRSAGFRRENQAVPTDGNGPAAISPIAAIAPHDDGAGRSGPAVTLEEVAFSFPGVPIFHDLSLEIPPGKATAILGRSGSGKTTLLRLIAGDLHPAHGLIRIGAAAGAAPPVGFVFQEPRLLPWRTVIQNVELVLPHQVTTDEKRLRREALRSFLESLRLPDAAAFPATLSGGMRHRVNLARGFLCGAPVICMDEPFANQDLATRKNLVELTRALEREMGRTVVIVTHDPEDALALADTIVVLADRRPTAVMDRFTVDRSTPQALDELRFRIAVSLKTR